MAAGVVTSKQKSGKLSQYAGLLLFAIDWIFQVDLDTALHFPIEVAATCLRPDIVVWSNITKTVIPCENNSALGTLC